MTKNHGGGGDIVTLFEQTFLALMRLPCTLFSTVTAKEGADLPGLMNSDKV